MGNKIYMADYGIVSGSGQNLLPYLKSALKDASSYNDCEIVFENGEYDIFCEGLASEKLYISNTDNAEDGSPLERHFAFYLKNMKNITLDGSGAVMHIHGKMTLAGIIGCENICIKNFVFETLQPSLVEMTVTGIGEDCIDCKVAPVFKYRVENGKIEWYGENYTFSEGVSQLFDYESGFTWREYSPIQNADCIWEDLGNGKIRLHNTKEVFPENYGAKCGYVFQIRRALRDECGILVSDTNGFKIENTTVNYMHEMGLMVQNSADITANGFNILPTDGRTAGCSSDLMHFSGCRGKITIENGNFCGAHDDAINIHGTHLKITERNGNSITVRFMHPQTFGIGGFKAGDKIAAVDGETLLVKGEARVISATEISPYEIVLETSALTDSFSEGMMIENLSSAPCVVIKNNRFDRIPTRGILVTTRGRVLIENNSFNHIRGSVILIADDAASWYEASAVEDVTVKNNTVKNCGGAFIDIAPENVRFEGAVHKNITVCGNYVMMPDKKTVPHSESWSDPDDNIVKAKSVRNLNFVSNHIDGIDNECFILLKDCDSVTVENNINNERIKIISE